MIRALWNRVMNTNKAIIKISDGWSALRGSTIFCVFLVLVLACATPIRNPFPTEKIKVSGVFPFDKGFHLEFYQYAHSTANWYAYICSGFGLIKRKSTCSSSREVLHPQRIDDQHYELTVYRDKYFSGLVGWTTTHSFFRAYKKDASGRMIFVTSEASPIVVKCDGNGRRLSQRAGRIFCRPDGIQEGYRYLLLTEDFSSGESEEINFYLYTE